LPVVKGQTRAATGLGTGQPQPFETQGELVTDIALAPETGAAPTLTEKTASPRTSTGLQARASTPSPANSTTTATSLSPAAPPTTDGSTAPLPVAVQKQTVDPSPDDPVKTDKPDGPHSTSAAPASHDVISSASVAQPQPSGVDASIQSAALPQQLGPTPQPTPSSTWAVTVATGVPVPVSGLAVEIAASAQSGKTRFEVRLDPADLGRIDVRIDVNRDGQVTSHLIAEKPETLSMLQQDAPQLQQALNDAGLKTGSGGLQFSLRDQSSFGGQNNGNQMQGNAQRLILSDETSVPPAAVAGQSYGRMLGLSGGVDIRV
jgi:flagellar hook-length control protein FliK